MSKKEFGLLTLLGACFVFASGIVLAQDAAAPKYQEGVHYKAIKDAPLVSGDKVEVAEAFSYLCSHCAAFEPYISNWVEHKKPENVNFRRIPVLFGRSSWEVYARAYITAEIMGIADKSHGALMDKLWKAKEMPRNIEELAGFYAGYGVTADSFIATSKSFAVDARIRKDQRDVQSAGVQGTPSLIVNGKYLVTGGEAVPNYDVMLDVVDYLVALETAAHPAAMPAKDAAAEENTEAASN